MSIREVGKFLMMRGRGIRRIGAALAVALAAGAFVVVTPAPALACGGLETITLRTFHLEVDAPKSGKIGTTAVIKVNITRPAKEDPLGQGIPMEDRPYVEPAEGVIVGVGLHIGNVFLPGAALTDAEGNAVIKIKLERYAPRNTWVNMSVYAWKIVQQTQCATVQEDGYKTEARVFKTS